jgi:uncharacterized protein (TIGR02186 family)
MRRAAILLVLMILATPAAAESLTVSLSAHRVIITSNFTGTDVVLFGTVGRDASTVSRVGAYDVVVTLRGPSHAVVLREKERKAGFWVNWGQLTFPDVPDYLAVVSSRPLTDIAGPQLRDRLRLGLHENVVLPASGRLSGPELMRNRDSLIRLKQSERRFIANATGVTFLNDTLFRASLPLPANVPIGAFEAEVRLFSGGVPLATQTTALEVVKAGFEADVADLARETPWIYGLVAALLAIGCGWLASVAFRRD